MVVLPTAQHFTLGEGQGVRAGTPGKVRNAQEGRSPQAAIPW